MAPFALFPTIFKTYEKRYTHIFAQKKFSKDIFNSESPQTLLNPNEI